MKGLDSRSQIELALRSGRLAKTALELHEVYSMPVARHVVSQLNEQVAEIKAFIEKIEQAQVPE